MQCGGKICHTLTSFDRNVEKDLLVWLSRLGIFHLLAALLLASVAAKMSHVPIAVENTPVERAQRRS